MKKKIIIIFLFVTFSVLIALSNFSEVFSENQSEIDKTISYVKENPQNAWSIMALAGAGQADFNLEFLKSVPSDQKSASAYAKYVLALTAAGQSPAEFGDEDYVEKLKSFYKEGQFGEENLINDDIWAILALDSVGQENLSMVQEAKNFILSYQNPDGGWSYDVSLSSSDTNDTSAAIMALIGAGVSESSPAIQQAVSFLRAQQQDDGGFAYLADSSSSDSCSDAWVISAIYKLGHNPLDSDWVKNGKSSLDHLKTLQDEDGGFWWQSEGDNKFCTPYVLISLSEKYYPVQTIYSQHYLRIEGQNNTFCSGKVSGATPLDIIENGSKVCGYDYAISEYPGMGLYLAEINGEAGWMYMVNNVSPILGADSYYLEAGDETLWFSGDWLEKGWFPTKIELTKSESLIEIQVKYYDSLAREWKNLEKEGLKIKVGSLEMTSNALGKIEISPSGLESGFYQVFSENQIIDQTGYIRSEKVSLSSGQGITEHKAALSVEIEKIEAPSSGKQESISFSVSPDILDFGKLKLGESSVKNLDIENGRSEIYLEAEVQGESVFQDNLEINENFWQFFSAEIGEKEKKSLEIRLTVPLDYSGSFGRQEGELTFWAIKK